MKILTTYRVTICENDLKTSSKSVPQLKTQRRNHNKIGGDTITVKTHTSRLMTHKQDKYNYNYRGSLKGVRILNPTSGSLDSGGVSSVSRR